MVEEQDMTIDKNKMLVKIKEMAQDLFFPNGSSQIKEKKLLRYSSEVESSQAHGNSSRTVEQLYEKSRVKILRLFVLKSEMWNSPP